MQAGSDRHESTNERLDRNFSELLNELRVALPGVQVLFAFLLVAPFNQGFAKASAFERDLYFATLLSTAAASILLIALPMHHRIVFRHHDKAYLVARGNRLTIAGLSVLAVSMTCAVMLVTHFLFGGARMAIVGAAMVIAFIGIWYGPALRRRARGPRPRDH